MSQALKNLLTLLNLEKIEEGLFRGQSEDLGLRQVFGGQVVGQALYAAKETVPEERLVHSFHSYFLRPGDSKKPIIYDVETLLDGTLPSGLIQDTASMLFGFHVNHGLSNLKDYKYIDYVAPSEYVNENWCPVFIAWSDSDLICVGQGAVMAEKLQKNCKVVGTYHCDGLLNNHCYHLNFHTREAKKCMAAFLRFMHQLKILP